MLKAKPIKVKTKKVPKAKKPKKKHVKPASSTVQHYQASHYKTDQIHTQGFFNPFPHNTAVTQSSNIPQAPRGSSGGIPYTSVFETYGITNKPPYFLESYIPKTTESTYKQPAPAQTSTTISGSNPMSKPKTNTFESQTKPDSINYVDLVDPAQKGVMESQPDYINIQPSNWDSMTKKKIRKEKQNEKKENMMMGKEEQFQKIQPKRKDTLLERAEFRKKNTVPESVGVSPLIKEKKDIINEKRKRLRGTKKNEEL